MAELKAVTAAAGDLEKRLAALNSTRLAGGNLIRDLQNVSAPRFQWDEGLRQTDKFINNLHRGKMEIQGINDLMDKWQNQSRTIAEQQTRLSNATSRTNSMGQQQMYVPAVNDIRGASNAMEVLNRQHGIQNEMLKVASTQLQNWGKNAQWAGRQLMVGISIPLAAAAAAAGVYAFQVDKEITRVAKVYDGAAGDVRGLALSTADFVSTTMGQTSKSTIDVMAQLAAVGKTGDELKRATIEVQRLATLGEMDQKTSIDSYIALQSTFKMSVDDTAQSINYMNAVENATSLSMQDFAKAIPVAAAPVAQLGGTVQELGTILVALKERGVDAAEGANAIKTLMTRVMSPSKEAKDLFARTGEDLDKLVKSTGGKLMPTMEKIADAVKGSNLSLLEQQQIIAKLGGAYQFTRLNAILDGLHDKSGQVAKAMEVAVQGNSLWRASADKELEAQTQSISGKFNIALQSFKTNLQGFGEVALKMATNVINIAGSIVGAFAKMPESLKGIVLVFATIFAVAGPLTMIVGIFANFIGTIGKAYAFMRNLGNSYKSMGVEQKAAALASGDLSSKYMTETDRIQVLVFELGKLQSAYTASAAAAQNAAIASTTAANVAGANTAKLKATESEKRAAEQMAYMMAQRGELKNTPSSAEIASSERMAYMQQERANFLANPRYVAPGSIARTGAPQFTDTAHMNTYADMVIAMKNEEQVLAAAKNERLKAFKTADDALLTQIRTQESYLTAAINERAVATKKALDIEKGLLLTGLREQAAEAKSIAVTAANDMKAMPSTIAVGDRSFRRLPGDRWYDSQEMKPATKEQYAAINEGLAAGAKNSAVVEENVRKMSIGQIAFNQNVMFGVAAVAALGSAAAGTGSTFATWLNWISLSAGTLAMVGPMLGSIREAAAKSNVITRVMEWSAEAASGALGKLKSWLGTAVSGAATAGKAIWGFLTNPYTLGAAAAGLAAFGIYKLVTAEAKSQVEHAQKLANTTSGWMTTLGQAEVKWGQIRNSSGQVVDDVGAMARKLSENNKDLVDEVARSSGEGLNGLLSSQIFRLQGQGLSRDDILKSMETLLKAAGKTKEEISGLLSNIKVNFDLKTPTSDWDKFLDNIQQRTHDAGIFRGQFQGKEGMFQDPGMETDMGHARTEQLGKDISGRLVGLDETAQLNLGVKIAASLSGAMEKGFQELKQKYGDQLKGSFQESVDAFLTFDPKQGFLQKVDPMMGDNAEESPAVRDLRLKANQYRDIAMTVGKEMGLPDDVVQKFKSFTDLLPHLGNNMKSASGIQKDYTDAVAKAEKANGTMTDGEKQKMAELYAVGRGLDATKLKNGEYAASLNESAAQQEENNRGIKDMVDNLNRLRSAHADYNSLKSGSGGFWGNTADNESGFGGLSGTPQQQGQMMNDSIKQMRQNQMNTVYDVASAQAEQQYKARMDSITSYYTGIKDRLNNEGKQMDRSWNDRMQAFSDSWKDRMDSTKKSYDDRKKAIENDATAQEKAIDAQIKGIEDQQKANQELDDQRKKMFEAEQRRMERLTELANSAINYNRALATGNLDEAARVMNNTERLQTSWGSQDAQQVADDNAAGRDKASQAQIDELKTRKDTITEAKQAKLDALAEEEDAVTRSLEKQQEMERRTLEAQKENEKERLQMRIDGLAKEQAAAEETERRKQEIDRKTLEIELATLKAFVPQNEAQLWEHIGRVQGAYDQHGISLTMKGGEWGHVVGKALADNVEAARVTMSSSSSWQESGAAMGDAIAKGAFGLSLGEFMNMVITGNVPATWKAASAQGPGNHTQAFMDMHYRHTGGEVNNSFGNRLGRTGALHSDEIPTVLQHGEYVINRDAASKLGPGYLEAINSGRTPGGFGVGGAELGFAGLAGGMAVTVMRGMMNALFLGSKKQQEDALKNGGFAGVAQKAGVYGGVGLVDDQLRNASIIASVGKSMGASSRDIMISFMTAMQESNLHNLNYGDRDSVGLFQQRPSQGWGSISQIMNPEYAARKFFEGLLRVGNRDSMPPTLAAQAVQRSGFPYAYAKWQPMAEQLLGAGLGSVDPNTVQGFGLFGRIIQSFANGGSGKYVRPTSGPITSEYGWRTDPFTGARALHDGIDIGAASGTPIYAADSGRVMQAGYNNGGFGNWTLIDHGNGMVSGYAHQSRIAVGAGQQVGRGQVIGNVGSTGRSTGAHLHFQMGPGPGQFQNPRNWIPSLNVGGTVNYDNVLANLHKGETVLTSPLSAALERGINNIDSGVKNEYHYDIKIDGSGLSPQQLKGVIIDVIETQKMLDMKKMGKIR